MRDVKQVKRALMAAAADQEPPDNVVQTDDLMDMMIQSLFDPKTSVPREHTLEAIVASAGILGGTGLSSERAREILLPDLKELKRALYLTASGEEPPAAVIDQGDYLDEMLEVYVNPCSPIGSDVTLSAVAAWVRSSPEGGDISVEQARRLLDGFVSS